VIDFGAGSKLRSRYFQDARIIAIEPLADRFRVLDFCDLDAAALVYSRPGEERIDALTGQADLVVSVNVLDHCFDFDRAVDNVAAYLRPSGVAFLSFDLHDAADEMHPLLLTEESCTQSFKRAGLTVQRKTNGVGPFGASYGHGQAINFWLARDGEKL
jgi:SAM-dependent methyltransferase